MKKKKINKDLDLHGVKHENAFILIEEHVLLTSTPFRIITGNSHTMKSITISILEKHKYKYQNGDLFNTGCIVVLGE